MQYVKVNNVWEETNEFYKKTNDAWGKLSKTEFLQELTHNIFVYNNSSISTRLEIAAPRTLTAETCQCNVTVNGIQLESGYQLSIVSGSTLDHITLFTSRNFNSGDVIQVSGTTKSDTFTFE